MNVYVTKVKRASGTNYREVRRKIMLDYLKIKKSTKRRPYVRSKYFGKQKIFIDLFWKHLFEKQHFGDQMRRIRYFNCALDLIMNSLFRPVSKQNPNRSSEILHRFAGETLLKELFFVQIKESLKTGEKCLMSVFPVDDRKRKKALR